MSSMVLCLTVQSDDLRCIDHRQKAREKLCESGGPLKGSQAHFTSQERTVEDGEHCQMKCGRDLQIRERQISVELTRHGSDILMMTSYSFSTSTCQRSRVEGAAYCPSATATCDVLRAMHVPETVASLRRMVPRPRISSANPDDEDTNHSTSKSNWIVTSFSAT